MWFPFYIHPNTEKTSLDSYYLKSKPVIGLNNAGEIFIAKYIVDPLNSDNNHWCIINHKDCSCGDFKLEDKVDIIMWCEAPVLPKKVF